MGTPRRLRGMQAGRPSRLLAGGIARTLDPGPTGMSSPVVVRVVEVTQSPVRTRHATRRERPAEWWGPAPHETPAGVPWSGRREAFGRASAVPPARRGASSRLVDCAPSRLRKPRGAQMARKIRPSCREVKSETPITCESAQPRVTRPPLTRRDDDARRSLGLQRASSGPPTAMHMSRLSAVRHLTPGPPSGAWKPSKRPTPGTTPKGVGFRAEAAPVRRRRPPTCRSGRRPPRRREGLGPGDPLHGRHCGTAPLAPSHGLTRTQKWRRLLHPNRRRAPCSRRSAPGAQAS
jgi:hypothetical protein